MSLYFDGLMRSSGLPLGEAPVVGPLARRPEPLALEEALSEQPPARPAPVIPSAAPSRGRIEAPPADAPHPIPIAPATRLVSVAAPAPVAGPAAALSSSVITPLAEPAVAMSAEAGAAASALAPALSQEHVLQSVMRWIAAVPDDRDAKVEEAPSRAHAPSSQVSAAPAKQVSAAPAKALVFAAGPAAPDAEAGLGRPVSAYEIAAVEPALPARAFAEPSSPHADFALTIGAIHVEIEAPPPPALRVAERAAPAPRPAPERSGLWRRSLRGF